MELILNDYSICGQFEKIADFEDYFVSDLKRVLDVVIEKKIPLYKKTDTFSRYLSGGVSLADYLRRQNDTVATLIKRYIIDMAYSEPYWDEEDILATRQDADYRYPYNCEEPNCFTEAIERECPLLSFPTERFEQGQFTGGKDDVEVLIDNVTNVKGMLDTYLKNSPEEISYFLESYPFEKNIVLARIGDRCYANEAMLENELSYEDKRKILDHIPNLIVDKSCGKKTHWWGPVEGEISEYRVSVSDNREFRLFFLWRESIILLNGFIKKTQETPESEKKRAREIVKRL